MVSICSCIYNRLNSTLLLTFSSENLRYFYVKGARLIETDGPLILCFTTVPTKLKPFQTEQRHGVLEGIYCGRMVDIFYLQQN